MGRDDNFLSDVLQLRCSLQALVVFRSYREHCNYRGVISRQQIGHKLEKSLSLLCFRAEQLLALIYSEDECGRLLTVFTI